MQKQLNEIYKLLQAWKAERRLSVESQRAGLLGNLCEELAEFFRAQNDNDRVDALCDIIVFAINAMSEPFVKPAALNMPQLWSAMLLPHDTDIIINASSLNSLVFQMWRTIEQLGYDPYKCMLETIKEISSRTGEYDESIGKWVKDKSPEAVAKWYKADYDRCKNDD